MAGAASAPIPPVATVSAAATGAAMAAATLPASLSATILAALFPSVLATIWPALRLSPVSAADAPAAIAALVGSCAAFLAV